MGALNSSIYTQRMVTQLFRNTKREDGRPLLGNGLIVVADDVLLHAKSQEEMLEILKLFMHTVVSHNLSCHPGKAEIFTTSTTYCGLRITREGITVDPERLTGLRHISPPRDVGDVWQFTASVGWIRDDIPLLTESTGVLSELITKALK